ncbi:hypothetical protein TTHERM_00832600 (macronuclear) [Tetrahymena thermophila SB210]|uniref:N-acetyltransferase domain-containing protein n=1 Tax=Tetrahymena thermophila (strain SB210) TaxID=312017 RepID=Q23A59_TETTS|nr:hypothetical protein TTHERM_00832600 [Tetrahymena thermophila SB210]EAR93421.1 hypothetical protein TTHERM_00832600 [Tetrahymena thermophila SB210]|eukprot:XP_001013666.1 hypothetical protein TTHERM_00832600 [Tetrahymena thermophila SB210]
MSFYPPGTVIHEENNIRYQIYSDEYFESAYETVVESRLIEGSIYSDFQVRRSAIEEGSKDFINNSVIRIIAIDTSLDSTKVVGSIFAEDFTVFVESQSSPSTSENLQILKKINKKLIQPLTSIPYKKGDIVIGSGYGVRKEYQDKSIGKNLAQLFLSVCLDSPYKVFCGLFYSQKASTIMVKVGGFLMCQLQPENCKEIDSNVTDYMKNNVEIVAYIDGNKEISALQKLKQLLKQDKPVQIV